MLLVLPVMVHLCNGKQQQHLAEAQRRPSIVERMQICELCDIIICVCMNFGINAINFLHIFIIIKGTHRIMCNFVANISSKFIKTLVMK